MNVNLPIFRNANTYPDRVAVIFEGKPLTFAQLASTIGLASARLAAAGVARGDVVALGVSHPVAYLALALGAARMGAMATPFDTTWDDARKDELLARLNIGTLVTNAGSWRSARFPDLRHMVSKDFVKPVDSAKETLKIPPVADDVDDQPWMIFLSSGTTGMPKSIAQTHRRCLLGKSLFSGVAMRDQQRVLVFTNLFVQMGMSGVIRQLVGAGTAVLTASRKPEAFFETVARDRPQRVATTTGTASILAAYAARTMPDSLALCESVLSFSVGGSSVSPALRENIQRYLCPYLEINYGSTEGAGLVQSTPEMRKAQPESAGRPYPWVDLQVVDEEDRPLPAGTPGVLRFASPLICDGYVGDSEATDRHFRNGWYYPGDTGSVDEAGYLLLTGRTDELINLGGNKIDPFKVEAVIDAIPGISESAVIGIKSVEGIPVMVALVVSEGAPDPEAIMNVCRDRLGPKYVPHRVLRAKSLPRNEGGKIMRKELTAKLQATFSTKPKPPTETLH